MTPERWQRIEELFAVAKPLSVEERRSYLANSCADDPELRREVERLLFSHDQAPSFIETPALEIAASQLANSQQIPVGKTIGRYRILSLIGVGGMGAVYLAEDTALGRKVALKLLLPSYASKDHDSLRRFQNEARAASALNHPNTAHIYEIGETDGSNYIAMEYVEGQSLDSRINGSPLDSMELLDVGIQVADALHEAHQKGITHRDIKSANIIIGPQGRV
ncbi:MAG: serine/threonine protein kinase, partial [Acidobacteria bacterium]